MGNLFTLSKQKSDEKTFNSKDNFLKNEFTSREKSTITNIKSTDVISHVFKEDIRS